MRAEKRSGDSCDAFADEWLRVHKGEHLQTVGLVWQCYDDCDCSQAQIVSYYQNKEARFARVPIVDWSGEFYTEGGTRADAELAAYRRTLGPDREASIVWQEGVDYDS